MARYNREKMKCKQTFKDWCNRASQYSRFTSVIHLSRGQPIFTSANSII
uniref:Uncharacterized protein n=1 Tax=Anguilla anguilla TaxID=7936 RepID=A0A0E9XLJ9_ANGAN